MSTSLSLSASTRVTYFPSSGDEDSASPDEQRHLSGHLPAAPRRLGRVALMAVIALAMVGGIVWQSHRAAEARRDQIAMETRDFELRTQALRAEMSTLQDRIGQTREQLGDLQARSVLPAQPRVEPRARKPPAARPQPLQQSRPTRPAPIVLTPGCANTPLGC